jgi:type IV pilus assembly protein PilO
MELSLTKLPWYGQIGAFVVVALGALFGFHHFYVVAAEEDMAGRQHRLAMLRADIDKGLATARQLPDFQQEVSELETRLEELKTVLPDQKDFGDLLKRLQGMAAQSNLTIQSFTPRAIATQQLHAEWPIALQVDGTYHNLGRFFDRVSKFQRIINISEIKIKGKERAEPNSTITAECVATTFVLLETPPGPAAPGAVRQ